MAKHTFRYVMRGDPQPGDVVELGESDAHHLVRVVRRRPGDLVEMIDENGLIWPATVEDVDQGATVRLHPGPRAGSPPAPVVLFQGLAEWNRIDIVVEKCAELGVPRIVMVTTERTRRIPDGDAWRRRRERMVRVAEAGARQSGQGHLPRVEGLIGLDDVLLRPDACELVMLDGSGDTPLGTVLAEHAESLMPTGLLIGPDSGFSENEVTRARAAGVPVCSLGSNVLRAETAALVAVTLALAARGHLARFQNSLVEPPEDSHG